MQLKKQKQQNSFFEEIYAKVREIPFGRVSSYGIIADAVGNVSPRMVGWAMNKCGSITPSVPAHRVVNRKGELTGRHHFSTPTMMEELLENEGIKIEQNRVIDFKNLVWIPCNE